MRYSLFRLIEIALPLENSWNKVCTRRSCSSTHNRKSGPPRGFNLRPREYQDFNMGPMTNLGEPPATFLSTRPTTQSLVDSHFRPEARKLTNFYCPFQCPHKLLYPGCRRLRLQCLQNPMPDPEKACGRYCREYPRRAPKTFSSIRGKGECL